MPNIVSEQPRNEGFENLFRMLNGETFLKQYRCHEGQGICGRKTTITLTNARLITRRREPGKCCCKGPHVDTAIFLRNIELLRITAMAISSKSCRGDPCGCCQSCLCGLCCCDKCCGQCCGRCCGQCCGRCCGQCCGRCCGQCCGRCCGQCCGRCCGNSCRCCGCGPCCGECFGKFCGCADCCECTGCDECGEGGDLLKWIEAKGAFGSEVLTFKLQEAAIAANDMSAAILPFKRGRDGY
ncbi:unnamed protein product [Rotaria magnacalcarata]